MAFLVHRHDGGLRNADALNRVQIEGGEDEAADALLRVAAPDGYLDLRRVFTPLPDEVHDFILLMNARRERESEGGDGDGDGAAFDFTIKGKKLARAALRTERLALCAAQARLILADLPSDQNPAVELSLFSQALALDERAKMRPR